MNRLTQKMSGAQISINPLLEPLGFIKVLEWAFVEASTPALDAEPDIQVIPGEVEAGPCGYESAQQLSEVRTTFTTSLDLLQQHEEVADVSSPIQSFMAVHAEPEGVDGASIRAVYADTENIVVAAQQEGKRCGNESELQRADVEGRVKKVAKKRNKNKIFSIFSFATCGGYSGKTSFNVSCPSTRTVSASFGYPFRLNTVQFTKSSPLVCNTTWDEFHLVGDYSPSSQFYVSVAVFAFLYCIGALALYIGYIHSYRESRKLPMIDFVVTIIFAFLWLVSASAWAKGLTDVKTSTDPAHIIDTLKANCTPNLCTPGEGPSMGSLNVSVVFGFLNLILWAGNAWFVYKETRLSDTPSELPPPQGPGNVPSPSSM